MMIALGNLRAASSVGASGLAASNDCTTIESIRDFDARSRSTLTIFGLRPSDAGHEFRKNKENQYACNEG